MLAGISPNYYLRLEQGRDRCPSMQVIDALARVLRLDGAATAFLHSLSGREARRQYLLAVVSGEFRQSISMSKA